jgi:hypothetical protein
MHLDNRRNTKGTYNDNKIIHEKDMKREQILPIRLNEGSDPEPHQNCSSMKNLGPFYFLT